MNAKKKLLKKDYLTPKATIRKSAFDPYREFGGFGGFTAYKSA